MTPKEIIDTAVSQARIVIAVTQTELDRITIEDPTFDALTQVKKDSVKHIADMEWTLGLIEDGMI